MVDRPEAMKVASPYINPKTNTVDVAGALMAGIDRGVMTSVVGQEAVTRIDRQLRATQGYAINPATGYPYTQKQAQAEAEKVYQKAYQGVMAQHEPRLSKVRATLLRNIEKSDPNLWKLYQEKGIEAINALKTRQLIEFTGGQQYASALGGAQEAAHLHAAPIRGARRQLLSGYQFPDEKPKVVTPIEVPPGVYDPRTPAQQLESGIPWLGTPPGVIVRATPMGEPVITSAPLAYIPPKGLKFSPEQTEYRTKMARLEKAVIPTLAPKMREAFAEGKRTGDFARYNKLVEESRVELTPEQERIRAALIEEYGSLQEAIKAEKELTTKEQERIRAALVEEYGSVREGIKVEAEVERLAVAERERAKAKLKPFLKEDTYNLAQIIVAGIKDRSLLRAATDLFLPDALRGAQEFVKGKTLLPDGAFILTEDLISLPANYRAIAEEQGFDALATQIKADNLAFSEALSAFKPYSLSEIRKKHLRGLLPAQRGLEVKLMGIRGEKIDDPGYNLIQAREDGKIAKKHWDVFLTPEENKEIDKLIFATQAPPTIVPKDYVFVSDKEFRDMLKPEDMTDKEYGTFSKFIHTKARGGIDITGAFNAGVKQPTIQRVMGLTDGEMKEFEWQAKFERMGDVGKMGMVAQRDPMGFAKETGAEMGLTMIPISGTARHWGQNPWFDALGIIADAAIVIPIAGEVGAGVKAGLSIPRAVAKASIATARGLVIAPYTLLRHPILSAKAMYMPIEVLARKSRLPLATIWRGSYAKGMDVTKVVAGSREEALATRQAMEDLLRGVDQTGNLRGTVPVGDIGHLAYSPTGLQKVLKHTTVTATPAGDAFKGKGVLAQGEGIWTAPEGYLGLTEASATGKQQLYIFKGKELIGTLTPEGKAIDDHGKVIGRLADKIKVMGIDGKPLGDLMEGQSVIRDGKIIGQYKNGAITTKDLATIGKYYKGQPEIKAHKVVGIINEKGQVVKEGKIVGNASEKVIGFITESTRIVGPTGVVIGKTKGQPAFVLIQAQGISELPDYAKGATTLAEMEKRAWELFKTGKYAGDLYPVFKQYAKWIELESLLPKGSAIIPVIGKNGKPVMMWTRGPAGNRIASPLMQVARKDWFLQSLRVTRAIGLRKPTLKPQRVAKSLRQVRDLPKGSSDALYDWLRRNPKVKIYGSTAEYIYVKGIKPGDVDLTHPAPLKVVDGLAGELRKATKAKIKVVKNIKNNSATIMTLRGGRWVEAVDLQPLGRLTKKLKEGMKPFEATVVDGVGVQTPESQLNRMFTRMADDFGGKGAVKFQRFAKALGQELDLGIGARPPSILQLARLKVHGIKNTIRDIFVKGLRKETRTTSLETIAPDLAPELRALMLLEDRLVDGQRGLRMSARLGSGYSAKQISRLRASNTRIEREIRTRTEALRQRVNARARALRLVLQRMPTRITRKEEELYRRIFASLDDRVRTIAGERRLPASRVTMDDRVMGRTTLRGIRTEKAIRTEMERATRIPVGVEAERIPSRKIIERIPRRVIPRISRVTITKVLPKKPPKISLPPSVRMIRGRPKLPDGSITWATGELSREGGLSRVPVWKWIPPPWTQDKPFTLTSPPIGAVRIESIVPSETIQMIGKPDAPVPERISIDQGAVDILVSEGGKRIEFFGGGLKTDYGKRLASPVTGMSIPGSDIEGDLIPGVPASEQSIDRTRLSKKKPRRVRRSDEFSDSTSLSGVRR